MFDLKLDYSGFFSYDYDARTLNINAVDVNLTVEQISVLVNQSDTFGSSLLSYLDTEEGKELLDEVK